MANKLVVNSYSLKITLVQLKQKFFAVECSGVEVASRDNPEVNSTQVNF